MRSFIHVGVVALLAFLPVGCDEMITNVSPNRERTPGRSIQTGDYAENFLIYDSRGNPTKFSNLRGDVTILTIVTAPAGAAPPVSNALLDLALRQSDVDVDVKYVIVCQPPGAQFDPNGQVTLQSVTNHRRLVILNDDKAIVSTLYGASEPNVYYVIDDDSRIRGTGDLADVAGIKATLNTVTRKAGMDNSIFNQP